MSSSCTGLMRSFVECLRHSPCVKEEGKTVTECSGKCPTECQPLRYALFACRRGQVDARTRIQGNKGY